MTSKETKAPDSKYVIDSWVWIEYFAAGPRGDLAQSYVESDLDIRITTINVAEVYKYLLRKDAKNVQQFLDFMLKRSILIPITINIAKAAGKIQVEEKMGIADSFIAATAQDQKAVIVTGDSDFKKFNNIEFIG